MNDKVNVRMCFVCRKNILKEKMLRITKNENGVFIDKTFKAGGRGAYICSKDCFLKAVKTKRFNSLLKCNISEEFLNKLESELDNA